MYVTSPSKTTLTIAFLWVANMWGGIACIGFQLVLPVFHQGIGYGSSSACERLNYPEMLFLHYAG